jgi:uncharacterized protein (DUF362 family)/Pyruvate/2-oxoacid:ferredoxin oxidoreductase delta subunit
MYIDQKGMTNVPSKNIQPVSIQKNNYADIDIESLLDPLGGITKYVSRGERVLLKTNLLSPSEPEKAVVTHPAVISAVAQAVLKIGGIPYIGDSPSGPFTKRRLEKAYTKSGLKALASTLGIELNYDTSVKKITLPYGKKLKRTSVCNFVLNAEKLIAFPKIKTHSYMIMTLATKIMYGAIPGLTKAKYHSLFIKKSAFADMLLDVLSIRPPDLFIMDGILGMQGDGPSGGEPVNLGVLLASEHAIALDLAVCNLLSIEPIGIPTLRQAKIRGLWPPEVSYPLLTPQDVRYRGFLLPSTADYLLTGKKTPNRNPLPTDKCTACKQCIESCPKSAIKIMNHKAVIDYSKCIRCYCCAEICSYNAIDLKVPERQ